MVSSSGNIMVPIAMFGWIPFVIYLFKRFEPRLAVAIAFVSGWMFLPVAAFKLPALPDYTKTTATCVGILFGAWLFDKARFTLFTFNKLDIPMALWCTAPFFSSVFNGLGPYDGLSQLMYQGITWGLPYYIARIYFNDSDSLKILTMAIFIGGIIYIPFCWFEMIMSPQLHRMTYGYHQHDFLQTIRDGGGFRPMVFMEHGLMTAMWMVIAVFIGTWLYLTGNLRKKIITIPTTFLLGMLIITTIMMQSIGAISLLLIGLATTLLSTRIKSPIPVIILLVIPIMYIYTRTTGIWDGRNLSEFVAEKFSPTRAQSLQFRFDNETILIEKALQGTFFGWGGYGRSRVYNDKGKDISIADGLWIIVLGQNGIYGLMVLTLTIQLPVFIILVRMRPEKWSGDTFAAPIVMAIFLSIYMIDNLLNAMVNPIYMLFCGGITSLLIHEPANIVSIQTKGNGTVPNQIQKKLPTTRFITAPCQQPSRFIN
ncbi:hypothetical protein [Chlorobium sp.]|uniref:hypothetical protein n=1 Tax=Chlorobium sp. TaxID=1095 RepID=UPI0025B993DE|nr:hypothetical protein [Chlorobium sp.]MCF8271899.1 hypothetical protein [Chlorobium sp.]MCF8291876.1 hypothetical protein [Chlorobium sp.]MCF8385988.1 hypothetical protein [Chlorobium sp.]